MTTNMRKSAARRLAAPSPSRATSTPAVARTPVQIAITPSHLQGTPIEVAGVTMERIQALISALMLVCDENLESTNEFHVRDTWMLVVLVDDHVRVLGEVIEHLSAKGA